MSLSRYDDDDEPNACDGSAKSLTAFIGRAAREQDRHRAHIFENMTGLVLPGIIEEAKRCGDPMQAYILVKQAIQVFDDLDMALHPKELFQTPEESRARYRRFIWHHTTDGYLTLTGTKEDDFSISKEDLQAYAGQYMARPWMQHDYIDWCIVDALVRWEWAAFHNDMINPYMSFEDEYKWVGRAVSAAVLAAFLGIPAAGVWYLYSVKSRWAAPAAVVLCLYAAWETIGAFRIWRAGLLTKVKAKQRKLDLLTGMRDAYWSLGGSVLSPTRVKDALEAAADRGVVWSQAIWPVIDGAVARNPNVWRVSPPIG